MNRRNIDRLHRAFTLVELTIAIAAALVVVTGVYTLWRCSMVLTAKCVSMNVTGIAAHNVLDRMQLLLQLAYTTPVALDSTGAPLTAAFPLPLSGTAAVASGLAPVVTGSAIITGTGSGISFYRHVGSPYLITVGTAGISATATQISFTADNGAQIPPPAPKPNDSLLIFTTAILSGTSIFSGTDNQVCAKLAAITGTSTAGTRVTYTATVTPPLVAGTIPVGISYQPNILGGSVDVSAVLIRPTAFVVVNQTDLRYYDSYVSGTNGGVNVNSNYVTLTNQLTISGTAAPFDKTPTCFSVVTYENRPFVGVILHLRARNYDAYLSNKEANSFATYMGVESLISLKSNP